MATVRVPIKRSRFEQILRSVLGDVIIEGIVSLITREWDGSASNYDSTEAYCAACLIDVNDAAGRDEKAQSHCMLPVKAPGSDDYDFEGVQAAAGGRGITQVEKPDDVPDEAWDGALTSAANTIISQYSANDEVAPGSVYEIAGKEPPEEGADEEPEEEPEEESIGEDRAIDLSALYGVVDWALWEMDGSPWLHGLFLEGEEGGEGLFAIASEMGKLYKVPVTILNGGAEVALGEMEQVVHDFKPVTESRTIVVRQAGGAVRWLSISCCAVLNRSGAIDSRALFDSFVAHAEETGDYPFRTFYHSGEALQFGQADFLMREGYCFITSGLYDLDGPNAAIAEAEIAAIERGDGDEWGESIGFWATEAPEMAQITEDVAVPVYTEGICQEISLLPKDEAASHFTTIVGQEVNRMRSKAKDALVKLFNGDEDAIEPFVEQVDSVNRTIEDEGLIARSADGEGSADPIEDDTAAVLDVDPDGGAVEDQDDDDADEDMPPDIEIDESVLDALAARLERSFAPLQERVEAVAQTVDEMGQALNTIVEESEEARTSLDGRLAALERDEEEKRQVWQQDLPRRSAQRVTYRPREANGPVPDQGRAPSLADVAQESLAAIKGG